MARFVHLSNVYKGGRSLVSDMGLNLQRNYFIYDWYKLVLLLLYEWGNMWVQELSKRSDDHI